jgi:hypothetical protein
VKKTSKLIKFLCAFFPKKVILKLTKIFTREKAPLLFVIKFQHKFAYISKTVPFLKRHKQSLQTLLKYTGWPKITLTQKFLYSPEGKITKIFWSRKGIFSFYVNVIFGPLYTFFLQFLTDFKT